MQIHCTLLYLNMFGLQVCKKPHIRKLCFNDIIWTTEKNHIIPLSLERCHQVNKAISFETRAEVTIFKGKTLTTTKLNHTSTINMPFFRRGHASALYWCQCMRDLSIFGWGGRRKHHYTILCRFGLVMSCRVYRVKLG